MSVALRIALGKFGRVALLDMDRPLVRHVHAQCHVLIKVDGYDTQFDVAGRNVPLSDENAVLVNAWERHSYTHRPGQPPTVILALYIEPIWLSTFRDNWRASGAPGFFPRPSGEITLRMRTQAREIAEAMLYDPGGTAEHERLIGRLMISTIERMALWRDELPSLRDLSRNTLLPDRRIDRAVRLIKANPGAVSSIDWLARESGLSRAQFFRLFENGTGLSPQIYLNMVRIERAIETMVNGTLPLSRISDDLGFSVPAHFSRFFHDHAGSAPGSFRKVVTLREGDI